ESHSPGTLLEWQSTPGAQCAHVADLLSGGRFELNLLRAYRIESAQESSRHIWVCVVEDVQRISRLGLPREYFNYAFAAHGHCWSVIAHHPSHRVLNQLAEVGASRTPEGAVYIAGKICDARCTFLFEDSGWLVCARSSREDHLWRERRVIRYDT